MKYFFKLGKGLKEEVYVRELQQLSGIKLDEFFNWLLFEKVKPEILRKKNTGNYPSMKSLNFSEFVKSKNYCPRDGKFWEYIISLIKKRVLFKNNLLANFVSKILIFISK